MKRMFLAKLAILTSFDPIGMLFFVFHCIVIALFALCAGKHYFVIHFYTSSQTDLFPAFFIKKIAPLEKCFYTITLTNIVVNEIFFCENTLCSQTTVPKFSNC